MMTEQQFKRRVKAITKAVLTNNIRSLSIKDCQWLIENYWLRPQSYWDLAYDWKRYSRKDFEHFYATFNLFEWIACEVDLNHALGWILHWVERKQGDCNNVKQSLEHFKQRCRLVHEVRDAIGLKLFHIHSLYSTHVYNKSDYYNVYNRHQKSVVPYFAYNEKHAIQRFIETYKPSEKDMRRFKIRRVRKVCDRALYYIHRDPRMTDGIFKYLTDNSIMFEDPTFGWKR